MLLRDFDDRLFTVHLSEDLRQEDERLEILAQATTFDAEAGHYKW